MLQSALSKTVYLLLLNTRLVHGAVWTPQAAASDRLDQPWSAVPSRYPDRTLLEASANSYRPCGGASPGQMPFKLSESPWANAPVWKYSEHKDAAQEDAEDEAEDAVPPEELEGFPAEDGEEDGEAGGQRRKLLGFTWQECGCSRRKTKVVHEHDGPGPRVRVQVRPNEKGLAACLKSIRSCSKASFRAGAALGSMRKMDGQRASLDQVMGTKRAFKTCALVGNAGHLLKYKLGKYIDEHEVVVRFNVMGVSGFEQHVGRRTTHRILNHSRSITGCCRGKLPDNTTDPATAANMTVLLWHPGGQKEILTACTAKYPHIRASGMRRGLILKEVAAMRDMRMDAARLGVGPFRPWRQLTSGAHAVLLFQRLCDTVSLYGMTTYPSRGPDQYAGRAKKSSSGRQWHDWDGEALTWRLMFASGKAAICSM